jgi:hypothetical protein
MIDIDITGNRNLRWGGGTPRFRLKIQRWLETCVGIHGVDWHIHRIPKGKRLAKDYSPPQIVLRINRIPGILFMVKWL